MVELVDEIIWSRARASSAPSQSLSRYASQNVASLSQLHANDTFELHAYVEPRVLRNLLEQNGPARQAILRFVVRAHAEVFRQLSVKCSLRMLGVIPKNRETRRRARVEAGQSGLRLLFKEWEQDVLALGTHSRGRTAGRHKLDLVNSKQ